MIVTKSLSRRGKNRKVNKHRVAGQPASGYNPDRYFYLQVGRTNEMKKALEKISSEYDSQKQAVEKAILNLARKL